MRRWLIWLALSTAAAPSLAHKASDSYLHLVVEDHVVRGQWEIALRDLEYPVGLDLDDDGRITWGELRARHGAIAGYALSRLAVSADGRPCSIGPEGQLVDHHGDGAYTVLRFTAACPQRVNTLWLDYRLLFELDPSHRGLLRLEHAGRTQGAVLAPDHHQRRFVLTEPRLWTEFLDFAREGARHIWQGYDHLLFLLALLLPAVLRREGPRWRAVPAFSPAFWTVVKIVTSFTVAHSITLSLAVLELVRIPGRWVEVGIALSVAVAAINNLYAILPGRLWAIAFGFGLVHGLGFATALRELGLARAELLPALAGFNLGVELGQLTLVALFLPLAYLVRGLSLYQPLVLRGGSLAIAALATVWAVQRGALLPVG